MNDWPVVISVGAGVVSVVSATLSFSREIRDYANGRRRYIIIQAEDSLPRETWDKLRAKFDEHMSKPPRPGKRGSGPSIPVPDWVPTTNEPRSVVPPPPPTRVIIEHAPPPPTPESTQVILHEGPPPPIVIKGAGP